MSSLLSSRLRAYKLGAVLSFNEKDVVTAEEILLQQSDGLVHKTSLWIKRLGFAERGLWGVSPHSVAELICLGHWVHQLDKIQLAVVQGELAKLEWKAEVRAGCPDPPFQRLRFWAGTQQVDLTRGLSQPAIASWVAFDSAWNAILATVPGSKS